MKTELLKCYKFGVFNFEGKVWKLAKRPEIIPKSKNWKIITLTQKLPNKRQGATCKFQTKLIFRKWLWKIWRALRPLLEVFWGLKQQCTNYKNNPNPDYPYRRLCSTGKYFQTLPVNQISLWKIWRAFPLLLEYLGVLWNICTFSPASYRVYFTYKNTEKTEKP